MRVIDLVFCPLNIIEMFLLSTNETTNKSCEILQELFFELSLTLPLAISSIATPLDDLLDGPFAFFAVLGVFAMRIPRAKSAKNRKE